MNEDPMQALLRLRASIDNIDAALVHILAERFRATKQVGYLKANHDLPASDPEREKQQVARLRALAEDAHLDPEFRRRSGSTSSSPRSSGTTSVPVPRRTTGRRLAQARRGPRVPGGHRRKEPG